MQSSLSKQNANVRQFPKAKRQDLTAPSKAPNYQYFLCYQEGCFGIGKQKL